MDNPCIYLLLHGEDIFLGKKKKIRFSYMYLWLWHNYALPTEFLNNHLTIAIQFQIMQFILLKITQVQQLIIL